MTTQAELAEAKPYHHGDLRRALLEAAEKILERDGPDGLSLRGVAREAGVSPAAPYHHFKDKDDLLLQIGKTGFAKMHASLAEAAAGTVDVAERLSALGLAYVRFAQAHPATYRVMYDSARRADSMPGGENDEHSGLRLVNDTIREAAGDDISEIETRLTAIASWCGVHGLAEMNGFAEFKDLKAQMGGEEAFLRGVLDHMPLHAAAIARHRS